ncbi:MAG: DnaJ domain-containing protein [Candidatus Nitrosocosmicus sp.]
MGNDNDHYKTLDILKNANNKEIKIAYRRLARKYHPDRNSKVSDEIMKNINIAFEVLSDPEKRKQYDETNFKKNIEDNNDYQINKYNNKEKSYNINNNYQSMYEENNSYSSDYANTYDYDYTSYEAAAEYKSNVNVKENETVQDLDIPKSQYEIIVEPSLCLAFGSCETLAPKVFVVEKNKRINPKAIVKSETGADFETILDAAKTCPTKAIIIIDRYSGKRIYP